MRLPVPLLLALLFTPGWPPVETSSQSGQACAQRRRAPRRSRRTAFGRWHRRAPASIARVWAESSPRPLVLRPVSQDRVYTIAPQGMPPSFDLIALRFTRKAFASRVDGSTAEVHPRLLELMYRAVLHFAVPYVHVISGYRPDRATSRHTQGRAVDMVLPGVSDRRLAAYLRKQGFVGVGEYPVSGFVHLDVRMTSSFWVDRSPPGGRDRPRTTRHAEARRYDREAAERGETPVPDLVPDEGASEGVEDQK